MNAYLLSHVRVYNSTIYIETERTETNRIGRMQINPNAAFKTKRQSRKKPKTSGLQNRTFEKDFDD